METSVSVMKLILILATLVLLSDAQDVVCKSGRTRQKILIGAGDSFSFKTQAGDSYAPNTKCMVTYKKKKACPMITFSCSEFDINNKDASCKRKDKMIVQEKGKARKSYCQSTGPVITSSAATLKVSFLSDKKRHSSGAVCTVQCYDGTTTATTASATTTASTTTDTTPPTTTGCKCGVKKTSRIVGGQETEVNEYPWMSALAYAETGSFFCGGTLIGDRWVVTASHCLFRNPDGTDPLVAEDLNVVLGEHDTADDNESLIPRKSVKVSRIIKHENYNAENSDNDVALLKLSEPVDLNVYTPACVARSGDTFIGQNAWVYGWGATSFGGEYPEKLLEVEVKIVSQDICKIAMAQYEITDGMLCAGGEANKDGCQGDSGGPLTVDVGGQHTLVGDVSWGNACGLEGQYGVYAETAYYRDWIDANIEANGGAQYCTGVEEDEELDLTGIIDPKVLPY